MKRREAFNRFHSLPFLPLSAREGGLCLRESLRGEQDGDKDDGKVACTGAAK